VGTKTASRSRRHRATCALAALTAVALLVPIADAPPATARGGAADPAAAGLDDLDWVPPVGSVMSSGGEREIVPLGRSSAKGFSATQSSGATGAVEPQYSYCTREKPEDTEKVDAVGCWWVSRFGGGENDPSSDYYFHEFLVNGEARQGRRVHRVKGRNSSGNGESVRWSPGTESNFGEATDVTIGVSIGYGGATGGVSRTFRMHPGRLHPYAAGRSVYHSSWIANGSGAKAGIPIESAGVNVWKIPQGQGLSEDANWFVWHSD